ncbi:hypothetical protein ACOMHN_052679 [Nucella lapillus]
MRSRGGECLVGVGGRVPWAVHYLVLLLPLAMSMVSLVDSGIRRPPVYWNTSNTMQPFYDFEESTEATLEVID